MKICVLGGRGMLGHQMFETLKPAFADVWMTVHGSADANPEVTSRYGHDSLIDEFDAMHPEACVDALRTLRPPVIINCIGILKHRDAARNGTVQSITVNGIFPHIIASAAESWGGRIIQISTDCVFSGRRGNYAESDLPDPNDLYGRSKLIGEPQSPNALTLRTSMIGPELAYKHSLLEWFLSEAHRGGEVKGYRGARFSGLTTLRLAQMVSRIIRDFPTLTGCYHVAGEPVSKYALLCILRDAYGLNVNIVPDDTVEIDRTLDSSLFEQATGMARPTWKEMIAEMMVLGKGQ